MVTTTDTSIWERNPFTSETNNKTPGALESVLFHCLKKDESKSNYFSHFLASPLSLSPLFLDSAVAASTSTTVGALRGGLN